MKDLLVKAFKLILYHFGIYRLLIALLKENVPIIMIHGVVDDEVEQGWDPSWERTSLAQLERIVSVLGGYFEFHSMDRISDILTNTVQTNRPTVCLSFDDGYRNNLSVARPLLARYDISAIYYLATGYILDRKPMWIDRLDFVLQQLHVSSVDINLKGEAIVIRLKSRSEYESDYLAFRQQVKRLYTDDKEMLMDLTREAERLEYLAGCSLTNQLQGDLNAEFMTTEDVAECYSDVFFGSHTVNHYRLDRISPKTVLTELNESKKWIESVTNSSCEHFCYPNGDFNQVSLDLVAKEGFRTAVTTLYGSNRKGESNLLALRRVSAPKQKEPYEILHKVVMALFSSNKVCIGDHR